MACEPSAVLLDRCQRGGDVAASELDCVDDEGSDLVESDSLVPTGGEREHFVVRGETVVAESAEQIHHRQIELAMSAVGRGIDQPAPPAESDQPVAAPQIAVQSRRRFRWTAERVQPSGKCFQSEIVAAGNASASEASLASGSKRFVA